MTTTEPTLHLRNPDDLLETVPYLLGFHAEESLVLLGIDRKRVIVTLRLDLTDAVERNAIDEVVALLAHAGASAVVPVIYTGPDGPSQPSLSKAPFSAVRELPFAELAKQAERTLERAGMDVLDSLLVVGPSWWSYRGRVQGCACCLDGHSLPGDTSSAAVSAVFAGMSPQRSRGALAALLDPAPEVERRRHLPGIAAGQAQLARTGAGADSQHERRSMKRALFGAAREADRSLIARPALVFSDRALHRFAIGLADIAIRDALWQAIDQKRLDGRGLWQLLLQRLPSPHDCAPLFLYGWGSWREGNGALATIAAERALMSNPGYTAAELLLNVVRNGLDPFRTPRLRMPARK